jgi:hypothetical protein
MPYPYTYQNPYQSYYPASYQPVYQQGYQQPTQQAQPQMQQQSFSPAPVSNGIMWVDDEREAAMFPVGPNNAVALWEKSGKRAYMKKADATGKPTMTVYDLVERAESPSDGGNGGDGKLPDYATKEELSAVVGVVKGYSSAIESMKSEMETMRNDLYGVAGRKRVVKKQEAEDE